MPRFARSYAAYASVPGAPQPTDETYMTVRLCYRTRR